MINLLFTILGLTLVAYSSLILAIWYDFNEVSKNENQKR
jgi:hypothetical protein